MEVVVVVCFCLCSFPCPCRLVVVVVVVVARVAKVSKMRKIVVRKVGFVSMCMLVVSNCGVCLEVQVSVVLLGVVVDVVVVVVVVM